MRERITFPSVISCIALFIALGGTALAIKANSVGSRQVRDDFLRGRDIRDGRLKGHDLAAGSIGPRELAEVASSTEIRSGSGTCNPDSLNFATCATVNLNLTQPSQVLLVAGGGQYGAPMAHGACKLQADSETLLAAAPPRFGDADARTLSDTNGLALTAVAGSLDRIQPGLRTFRLLCNQEGVADVKFDTTLSAVAFGDGLG